MKARAVDIAGVRSPRQAIRLALAVRAVEVLALAPALDGDDARALHDLRIAGKRLRYALELFGRARAHAKLVASLALLHDALGDVHDCDRTAALAVDAEAPRFAQWLAELRRRRLGDARAAWRDAHVSAALLDLVHGDVLTTRRR